MTQMATQTVYVQKNDSTPSCSYFKFIHICKRQSI